MCQWKKVGEVKKDTENHSKSAGFLWSGWKNREIDPERKANTEENEADFEKENSPTASMSVCDHLGKKLVDQDLRHKLDGSDTYKERAEKS